WLATVGNNKGEIHGGNRPAKSIIQSGVIRRATRHVERVVLDVLAVVLKRDPGRCSLVPQMALLLVGNRIAAVGGVVAEPVRRLDVIGVGSHGLDDPVVTV